MEFTEKHSETWKRSKGIIKQGTVFVVIYFLFTHIKNSEGSDQYFDTKTWKE